MRFCDDHIWPAVAALLKRYRIDLVRVESGESIPGSYWGEPEAGIIGSLVYARPDTPLHSVLHEAAHVICMGEIRRAGLHTDAGGDFDEENAVCYLQIVLAEFLGVSVSEICADMDEWGYTFRLGSAKDWFEQDADDARSWLSCHDLIVKGRRLACMSPA